MNFASFGILGIFYYHYYYQTPENFPAKKSKSAVKIVTKTK